MKKRLNRKGLLCIFAAALIVCVIAAGRTGFASGEDNVDGALKIVHICGDCNEYDLGISSHYDYIGDMDHTFKAVITEEYQSMLDPDDIIWRVWSTPMAPDSGLGAPHYFHTADGAKKEEVEGVDYSTGDTLTFRMESGYMYEIWAYVSLNGKFYMDQLRSEYVMKEVYRNPDDLDDKVIRLRPGKSYDYSEDLAHMFNSRNLSAGGETVRIGDCAETIYMEEGGNLWEALETSGLTITPKEGYTIDQWIRFNFGDCCLDDTRYTLEVLPDQLQLGVQPPANGEYWYEPEEDETLYVRYEANLEEVSALPKIYVKDSEDQSFDYISKNVTSTDNIRRSCGSFSLEKGKLYFFEFDKVEEKVTLSVTKEKPDDYDEIQAEGGNSTALSFRQSILGVEESYTFTVGDPDYTFSAYTNSGQTVRYNGGNKNIVSVSGDGILTIIGPGETTITLIASAYTNPETNRRYGSESKKVTIIVKETTVSIAEATVSGLGKKTYTGKAIKPAVTVKLGEKTLTNGTDYTVSYSNNKTVGTAKVVITGIGTYTGSIEKTFKIMKAENPLTVKGKTVTLKYANVKKKNQTILAKNAFAVSKNQGKVTYKKSAGNNKITISSAGKITVKKGLKKGTYKLTVKMTAAGNSNYNKVTKTAKVTIKVK